MNSIPSLKIMENKQNILILGGGFGGVTTAKHLLKYSHIKNDFNIILISKTIDMLFTPTLYEFATDHETKENVSINLNQIFDNSIVQIKIAEVTKINSNNSTVDLITSNGVADSIDYQYLVIALGSIVNDHGIKGLKENAYYFKTMEDGEKIKKGLKELFSNTPDKHLDIVIGGAGYSGVEIAAEIAIYREELCLKDNLCRDDVKIILINPSQTLFKDMSDDANNTAKKKLHALGVQIIENERILKIDNNNIYFQSGNTQQYNFLTWAGGVKGPALIKGSTFKIEDYAPQDKVWVDEYLRIPRVKNVYACGDCAELQTNSIPMIAEAAIEGGITIAHNISSDIQGKALEKFKFHQMGKIVPLDEGYSYADLGFIRFKGKMGYIIQKLVYLKFLLDVLPFAKAIIKWLSYIKILIFKHGQ